MAVCVAIVIVVAVTAGNDWQKQKQFGELNERKHDREVRAIRSGKTTQMRISDLTVGDIVCLEPGDTAPADGIVLANYEIKCDESLATGESDQVEKCSGFKYLNTMISVIQIKTKRVTNVKLRCSQVDNDLI
ncbi:hypothetical protein PEBR_07113 [Penicillium brasilianum]|uniref:P-type ATPase A domain-containing protein n=1 Tax=Penicillium brasilianum TaxID=104259 RepID=A0A1S9RWR5_PENBI|nr:hypothetical protein PEBR_07113 [Penicillium brasilianum]